MGCDFSNELRILPNRLVRRIDRHLIPDLSVEHSASLLLVPSTPLLKEKGYFLLPALITQIGDPFGIYQTSPEARLATYDDPINST
jgi:hypothetical protein